MVKLLAACLALTILAGSSAAAEFSADQRAQRLAIGALAARLKPLQPWESDGQPAIRLPGFTFKISTRRYAAPCGINGDLSCDGSEDTSKYFFVPDEPTAVPMLRAALRRHVESIGELARMVERYQQAFPGDEIPRAFWVKKPADVLRSYQAAAQKDIDKAGIPESIAKMTGWEDHDKRLIGTALRGAAYAIGDQYQELQVRELASWGTEDSIQRQFGVEALQKVLNGEADSAAMKTLERLVPEAVPARSGSDATRF